jgi:hypothetical protein
MGASNIRIGASLSVFARTSRALRFLSRITIVFRKDQAALFRANPIGQHVHAERPGIEKRNTKDSHEGQ